MVPKRRDWVTTALQTIWLIVSSATLTDWDWEGLHAEIYRSADIEKFAYRSAAERVGDRGQLRAGIHG